MNDEEFARLEIFEKALMNILSDTEGIFLSYGDDKVLVVRTLDAVEIYDANDMPEFKENEMIWFHLDDDLN